MRDGATTQHTQNTKQIKIPHTADHIQEYIVIHPNDTILQLRALTKHNQQTNTKTKTNTRKARNSI